MNFFDSLVKSAGNEFAAKVSDGLESDAVHFIDTGSYTLNALLSGSIYGGIPGNKVIALAGEESTGKTFYALSICQNFQKANPKGAIVYFESEGSLTTEILKNKGIDTERFYLMPIVTIQDFRTQALKIVNEYLTKTKEERDEAPMLFVLDSLGNCATNKEVQDIADGKDTRDMTRAQLVRGAFRVLTLKLNRANIPMLVTNHTYDVVGAYMPTKEMCLVAGTGVRMSDGNIKNINDIQVGDQVLTTTGNGLVTDTHEYSSDDLYELRLEDGSTVTCTAEHKFLMDGDWVTAAELWVQAQSMRNLNMELTDFKDQLHELSTSLSGPNGSSTQDQDQK